MLDVSSFQVSCPKCNAEFVPVRTDQKYCSQTCRKNATRGPRTVADSPTEKRRQEMRLGRLQALSDAFFETPPIYRAAFMIALINEAKRNKELRVWITQRDLMRQWLHQEGTGRLHIAQCLDHFCSEAYGYRSYEVVRPNWRLPSGQKPAFPAAYFGPTSPSIYTDGNVHNRPCPWSSRHKGHVRPHSQESAAGWYDCQPAFPFEAFRNSPNHVREEFSLATLPNEVELTERHVRRFGYGRHDPNADFARIEAILVEIAGRRLQGGGYPPPPV